MENLLAKLAEAPHQRHLVLMPISRLLVEDVCRIGEFVVYPPGEIDLERLRPIPNKSIANAGPGVTQYSGQDLREIKSSATGFDCRVLTEMPLVAFIAEIDWESFLSQSHDDDIESLRRLSATAERALDFIRLHFCRFDLPGLLPGPVGSWMGSGAFLGALLYTLSDHESYLIAGEAIECSVVAKGLGLDLSIDMTDRLPEPADGEVAAFAIHALSLFSDVMTSNSDTLKFGRAMTLIEFLANPDDYRGWKKLKGDIVCHIARDKTEYHDLCRRFEELTSIEDQAGNQAGLRTLVIHHGRFLNDIIPNPNERKALFRELQRYAACVLDDMLENAGLTWKEFQEIRNEKKKSLGVA